MWKRTVDGKVLTFRLAGINNQNFLMRDEETGSYWQQISGLAISGPLRGKQLELAHSDEITFGLWKAENPQGSVLKHVESMEKLYAEKDWDVKMSKRKTVVDTKATGITERELMIGLAINNKARAYPVSRIMEAKLIQDIAGGQPVILVLGPDGKSIRVFEARIPGRDGAVDFYRELDGAQLRDAATGSLWNFQGCAVEGDAKGKCLKPVYMVKDYWFDWQLYHPDTSVFGR